MGEVYVGPYLHFEPRFSFCLDLDGPAGYVLATFDTPSFEQRCEAEWWPPLRERYPRDMQRRPADQGMVETIHHPVLRAPELTERYPSQLHIDLLPRVQGQGYGPRMLEHQLATLAGAGSPGVHLGVATGNLRAQKVYRRLGFTDWKRDGGELIMVRALP